ncbi:hypothetical protein C4K06_5324 [Pseudomonas chlororaphis subsp. aureofaciens]|nr:hypothetical protein C4K06_5324 [Pseudomonas chlororaphis subsp. aureofaciens]
MLALDQIGASDDLQSLSVRNRTTEKSSLFHAACSGLLS